uniref:Uncharacterized protein n=2 Tax=Caenorhabditis japonica TaxID=281687 RepID=A0A8R1IXL2_CAEJA
MCGLEKKTESNRLHIDVLWRNSSRKFGTVKRTSSPRKPPRTWKTSEETQARDICKMPQIVRKKESFKIIGSFCEACEEYGQEYGHSIDACRNRIKIKTTGVHQKPRSLAIRHQRIEGQKIRKGRPPPQIFVSELEIIPENYRR